jgi:hypothetical protein
MKFFLMARLSLSSIPMFSSSNYCYFTLPLSSNLFCWANGNILLRCFFPSLPQPSRGPSSSGTSFQKLFWVSVVDRPYYMSSPLWSFNKCISCQSFSLYSLCSASFCSILQTPLFYTGPNVLRMISLSNEPTFFCDLLGKRPSIKKNEVGHFIFAWNIFHTLSKTGWKGVIKICTTFGTNFHKPRINKNCLKLKSPCILKFLTISIWLHLHWCVSTTFRRCFLPTLLVRTVQTLICF